MTLRVTADLILSHPGFTEARNAHVAAVVAMFRGDRLAMRMMTDAGVIVFRGFLVGFHMAFDADDPDTWATAGNLARALVSRGLASARRVDDLLARFRLAGYVEPVPAPGDRRVSIMVPAGSLVAHDRAHLAAYHRFLLDLFPGRGYEWVLSGDERAHRAIRRAAIRDQPRAVSALLHDAMRLFLARDAGYLAFLLIADAQRAGRDAPSWTSLSNELGVARSHLRKLFGEAEAAGYVTLRAPDRRPVAILPSLWSAYDRFIAGVEADQDAIAQAAFAAAAD